MRILPSRAFLRLFFAVVAVVVILKGVAVVAVDAVVVTGLAVVQLQAVS